MKSATKKMLIVSYVLGAIAVAIAIFHRQISHNPDDMTVKNIGLGVLLVAAILRITGSRRKKAEEAASWEDTGK